MSVKTTKAPVAKPILKWAGGKTQMLGELMPRVPKTYGRYIEPFFGGGALFFSLKPENAIIADSNPELINMYLQVAHHVDDVIECLQKYENTSEMFYEVRSLDWQTLPKAEAAARTIYLNKTCFNGLYRTGVGSSILRLASIRIRRYVILMLCDLLPKHFVRRIFSAVIIYLFLNTMLSRAILYFWIRRIFPYPKILISRDIPKNSFMRTIMLSLLK